VPDERGWTAVHQAASRGGERMLRALLAKGGDASLRDSDGLTPLDVARSRGRPALVELLSGGPAPAAKPKRPRRKA
jgi:ankyrin repeat protein